MRGASLLPLLGSLAACQPVDCAEVAPSTGIAAQAAVLRVEIYPPPAVCQGTQVQPMGTTPLRVLSQPLASLPPLSLSPGTVVVHVRAFGDAQGTAVIGEGCSPVEIRAGQAACLPAPLVPTGGVDGGCQPVTHSNGVGKSYSDCTPLGTFNRDQATEACIATTGDSARCRDTGCSGGAMGSAVCAPAGRCVCWTYSGPGVGLVHTSSGGGCDCGMAGDPAWD